MYNTTFLTKQNQIQTYFDCLDTNGDGVLSIKDQSMEHIDVDHLITGDLDKDGSISPEEFDPALAPSTTSASVLVPLYVLLTFLRSFHYAS